MTTKNIGGTDTAIRAGLGSFFMVWAALVADSLPFLALGAGLFGTLLLVTAITGACPLYTLLGVDTHPNRPVQTPPPFRPQHPVHHLG
jgi:hypothetical protein